MEKIDIESLKVKFKGKPFYLLVLYHLKRTKNTDKLREAAVGTIAMLPQSIQTMAVDFIDKWSKRAYEQSFWRKDTYEVFSEIIEDARSLLSSSGAPTGDETLFNMFQIVVLSYAYSASDQPNMRKFIEGEMKTDYDLVGQLIKRAFRNGLIVTFILMGIWAVVLEFIPAGWWVLAINIVGILLTAWIMLSTTVPFLKLYMRSIIAPLVGGLLWATMFVAIRFLISLILGTT